MVEEDQNQICSNSSSGGGGDDCGTSKSSPKKLKHKKVPQRGLGVAQLEKIRIQEQQKKEGSNNHNSPYTLSPTNSSSHNVPSLLPFPTTYPLKSPPQSMSSNDLPSPCRIFGASSLPNIENFHFDSLPPFTPSSDHARGFDIGWLPSSINPSDNNNINVMNFPTLWHPFELSTPYKKLENFGLNDHGLSFCNSNLSPIIPLPDIVPRTQQYQQPSLVNASTINSSSSSSCVLNFPLEPPSSQSFYSSCSPLWLDEEKMGKKRPYPFHTDNPPIPTFHGKFIEVAATHHPISGRTTTFNFDPSIPIFREFPSCTSAMIEPAASLKKTNKLDNANANGEFLTLAPPPIASPYTNSRFKQSSTLIASYNGEYCNFESLSYHGNVEEVEIDTRQPRASQQPHFFSFFPSRKVQASSISASVSSRASHSNSNGDVGESVDLNLRL